MQVLRHIEAEALKGKKEDLKVFMNAEIALYLLNQRRDLIANLEDRFPITITLEQDNTLLAPDVRFDEDGIPLSEQQEQPRDNNRRNRRGKSNQDRNKSDDSEKPAETSEQSDDEDGDEDKPRRRHRRGKRGGRRRGRRDQDQNNEVNENSDENASEAADETDPNNAADTAAPEVSEDDAKAKRSRGAKERRCAGQ